MPDKLLKCAVSCIPWLTFFSASVLAQDEQPASCDDLVSYHALDFWLGNWDVFIGDAKVGTNRIEKTLSGCAVFEHWVASNGGEGKSLFYFSDAGKWKQVWVTEFANLPGGVKEKTMVDIEPEYGVRFQGKLQHADIGTWLDRTTLTPLDNGDVRQVIETSTDNGTTWKSVWDAIYRRAGGD